MRLVVFSNHSTIRAASSVIFVPSGIVLDFFKFYTTRAQCVHEIRCSDLFGESSVLVRDLFGDLSIILQSMYLHLRASAAPFAGFVSLQSELHQSVVSAKEPLSLIGIIDVSFGADCSFDVSDRCSTLYTHNRAGAYDVCEKVCIVRQPWITPSSRVLLLGIHFYGPIQRITPIVGIHFCHGRSRFRDHIRTKFRI